MIVTTKPYQLLGSSRHNGSKKALTVEGLDFDVSAIAVSPKGDLLMAGLGGGTVSGDALKWSERKGWERGFRKVTIWRISDGQKLAAMDAGNVKIIHAVWDVKDRFVAYTDSGHNLILWQPREPGMNYVVIHFVPVARREFVAEMGGFLDIDGAEALNLVFSISPDGKALAVSGGSNITVYSIVDN